MRTADFPAGSVAATAAVCERPHSTSPGSVQLQNHVQLIAVKLSLGWHHRLFLQHRDSSLPVLCRLPCFNTTLCGWDSRPTILFPHLLRNGKVHDQNRNSHDAASSNWLHAADSTCHTLTSGEASSLASACAMQRSKRSMTSGLPQTLQASHRNPPTASASWPTAAA